MSRTLFVDGYGVTVEVTDGGVRLVCPAPRTLNVAELHALRSALDVAAEDLSALGESSAPPLSGDPQ